MQFVAHVACKGEKSSGMGPWENEITWRSRCRWEGNIKMALNK